MVEALREWVTAVVAAAVLVSAAERLTPKGSIRKIASFIGGLVLLLVLLRPMAELRPGRIALERQSYQTAISRRAEELGRENNEALAQGIARETEAYISDKAAALGLEVRPVVTTAAGVDGLPVPWRAELDCGPSPQLAAVLEQELGIPQERQVFHGTG